ncbi:MAG: hypothetical protein H6Q20_1863 [Bacteroidetes bacterium]|nr:hypothetical protein [Bacteroidota bacterium]
MCILWLKSYSLTEGISSKIRIKIRFTTTINQCISAKSAISAFLFFFFMYLAICYKILNSQVIRKAYGITKLIITLDV